MPLARFKDLVIDANDPMLLGSFWADVLGLTLHRLDDGDMVLRGISPQQTLWINRVPELKTAKHRMHLDVFVRNLAEVKALGGSVLSEQPHWTVMADPEGGEFCAFVRDDVPEYRLYELILDCADPAAQARWWAELLGGEAKRDEENPWWWVEGLDSPFEYFGFNPVPEPKTVKNRVHLDVSAASLDAVTQFGATLLRPKAGDIRWHVLADPEGNEFCLFDD